MINLLNVLEIRFDVRLFVYQFSVKCGSVYVSKGFTDILKSVVGVVKFCLQKQVCLVTLLLQLVRF